MASGESLLAIGRCETHKPKKEKQMINLDDSMTATELFAWSYHASFAPKAMRLEVFGRIGKGTVRAMKDCSHYAANKATAMQCRARGELPAALLYENIAERIYASLPSYAKW